MTKMGITTKCVWEKKGNYEKSTTTYLLFNEKNELVRKESFHNNDISFLQRDEIKGVDKSIEILDNAKDAVKECHYDIDLEKFIYKFFGEKKVDWRVKARKKAKEKKEKTPTFDDRCKIVQEVINGKIVKRVIFS